MVFDQSMVFDQFMAWCLHPVETVDMFLAELEKLAILIGKLPEQWTVCAFVPASSRMDNMTMSQLLTSVHTIVRNEKEFEETVTAATQPAESHDNPTTAIDHQGNITCHKCHGPNHFAKECQYQPKEMQHRSVQMSCMDIWWFWCQKSTSLTLVQSLANTPTLLKIVIEDRRLSLSLEELWLWDMQESRKRAKVYKKKWQREEWGMQERGKRAKVCVKMERGVW